MFCYCSLANADAEVKGAPRELITNDRERIAAFVKAEDKPGRGVFFCPNPLKPGATRRAKETVDRIVEIGVDQDSKDIQESQDRKSVV